MRAPVQPTQLAPPTPQAFFAVPSSQRPLVPQHPAQLAGSQTQLPLLQRCPAAQGWPVPHAHWPLAQRSASSGSHAVHALPWRPHAVRLLA